MVIIHSIIALAAFMFWSISSHAQNSKQYVEQKFQQCCKDLTNHTIDAKQAKAKLNTAIFVDARSDEERSISIIPGAILPEELTEKQKKEDIIVYCTIGYRSGKMTEKLREKGYQARNLEGGILAWTWAQGPLIDSKKKTTRKLHTWSDDWKLIAPGYEVQNK